LDTTTKPVKATKNMPHYSIHLGDIYYVGSVDEIDYCC